MVAAVRVNDDLRTIGGKNKDVSAFDLRQRPRSPVSEHAIVPLGPNARHKRCSAPWTGDSFLAIAGATNVSHALV